MAIRPAFQFYPADWRNNAKLRRCSPAARGVWVDVLCILHDSDEYGVLRWPLADIAQAAGATAKLLRELVAKGVLKGADSCAEAFVFAPRHGGKDGDPVTLVESSSGPCWYCSRFVRDEYVRQRRGANTRFSDDNPPPKKAPKAEPKVGIGDNKGYGASSSSSVKQELLDPTGLGAAAPVDPLWHTGLSFLVRKGVPEKSARSFLGKLKQAVGDMAAGALLAEAESDDITDPVPWLQAAAKSQGASNANRPQRSRVGLADRHPRPDFDDDAIPGQAVRIHY